MALREIRLENDPLLRKISKPVKEMNDRTRILIEDMISTMKDANGVGIAAPQVGVLKRIFVILDENANVIVFINPEILKQDGEEIGIEGCLSVHSRRTGYVSRPKTIKIKAQDINMNYFEMTLNDFIAREFCHEYDHLDGILYIDKVIEKYDEYDELVEDYLDEEF